MLQENEGGAELHIGSCLEADGLHPRKQALGSGEGRACCFNIAPSVLSGTALDKALSMQGQRSGQCRPAPDAVLGRLEIEVAQGLKAPG